MFKLEFLEPRTMLTSFLVGDMNHDGVVNAMDAHIIAEYGVHLRPLTPQALHRGDFNGDGRLNGVDAAIALTLGLGKPFTIGGQTFYPSRHYGQAPDKLP